MLIDKLDHRLKEPRTSVVLCSRFNDAPGTSAKAFLQHMKQTFSERFDVGKVSILSLPRSGEAREMKDDTPHCPSNLPILTSNLKKIT